MTIAQMIVAFAMIWWLVFFMVLPFGTKMPEKQEGIAYAGAPETRSLRPHYMIASALSLLIMAALYWTVEVSGWQFF